MVSSVKGFTLIEIIVVMVIVAMATAFAIPSFISSIEQTRAQTARDNLYAIMSAQSKFYEDYNSYCTTNSITPCYCISTGTNPTGLTTLCGDTKADININLKLSIITNDPFTYVCASSAETIQYNCTATDNKITVTLDPNNAAPVTCTPVGSNCPF